MTQNETASVFGVDFCAAAARRSSQSPSILLAGKGEVAQVVAAATTVDAAAVFRPDFTASSSSRSCGNFCAETRAGRCYTRADVFISPIDRTRF